jgi:hypothetical protein
MTPHAYFTAQCTITTVPSSLMLYEMSNASLLRMMILSMIIISLLDFILLCFSRHTIIIAIYFRSDASSSPLVFYSRIIDFDRPPLSRIFYRWISAFTDFALPRTHFCHQTTSKLCGEMNLLFGTFEGPQISFRLHELDIY